MESRPDTLRRQLKAQAATEGVSLPDFLIRESKKHVDKPTVAEIRERLARRSTVNTRMSADEALRRERYKR